MAAGTGGAGPLTARGGNPVQQVSHAIGRSREFAAQALQGVNAGRVCAGCGGAFQPTRRDQRHCRLGCRVLALRKRQASSALDQLAAGIAAGHVESEVILDPVLDT